MRDTKAKKIRRRYKIVKPYRFFIFVLVCIMTLVFTVYGMFGISRADAESQTEYVEVKIQNNDTLWDIVETYNPDSDININTAIYDIYEVNNISAGDIRPGDVILIPMYK